MKKFFIAKEGLWIGFLPFLIGLLFVFVGWKFLGITLCFIGAFVLFFFRYPDRKPNITENLVYAPSDGRIIRIKEEPENMFFNDMVYKISIFMNVLNVHITYAPVCGNVEYIKYMPGKFINADRISENSEELNENNFIGINNNGKGKLALRQVAGYIARRIVCDVKEGDQLSAGERLGLIKFGSRIDVFLPKNWKINVKEGERTKAGRTVLAKME